MTRWEVLQHLSHIGRCRNFQFDSDLRGIFSWNIEAKNGFFELTATFQDVQDGGIVDHTYTWVLKEV